MGSYRDDLPVIFHHVGYSQNQGIVVHFIDVVEDFQFRELISLEQISEEAVYVRVPNRSVC